MFTIIKTFVVLIMLSCAFVGIAKDSIKEKDFIKEIDFTENSKAIDDELLGTKVLKYSEGYVISQFSLKDVKNTFNINIKASARNGAKLGMIIFRISTNPSKREKIKQFWNVKFPENELATKSFKVEDIKNTNELNNNYQVFIYRSNKKGELLLNNISVKPLEKEDDTSK